MPTFKIAHVKEQGIDLIIVPLDSAFHLQTDAEKTTAVDELQLRAESAGLAGAVIPVWQHSGKMYFIAPDNWHPFFKSITYQRILLSLNKTLSW